MERTRAVAREQGYVETLFGRRLYLPEINARNKMRAQAAERTAINAPMQVHDELVFEVAATEVDTVRTQICRLMSEAAELSIPLLVEVGVGNNWDEAH